MDKTKFTLGTFSFPAFLEPTIGIVDGQITLGQKWQSHKLKVTDLHLLIMALSQIIG
jgi:hypothetical protein